ncbi:MAG TPA: hypothetical protein VIX19_01620 [Terriglobales bacterium]
MKKSLLIATVTVLMISGTSHAQFGGVVYDPTNFHNALLRYYQLRMQLAQLQQTYRQILAQYNLAVQMAKNLQNMPARYQATFSQWRSLTTVPNVYQNTGGWVNGVNSGALPVVMGGYQQAIQALSRYSPQQIASMNPDELQRATANYASVELADGANTSAMATIGNIRANAPVIQSQIGNLQADSFSGDPSLNSEVGVLNKINAANMLILRSLQDSNNLRLAALEQQVIESKRQRDAEAALINTDIDQRANMVNQVKQFTSGLGSTLQSYRLP